jgi:hypothetical protein
MSNIKNTSYKVIVDKVDDADHDNINVENGSMHYIKEGVNKGLYFHLDDIAQQVPINSSYVHGWANYADSVWTEQSPFSILAGNTAVLDNNANTNIEAYLPIGVSTFYDGLNNKILAENIGDSYTISVRFRAKTSINNDYFDIGLDIGGLMNFILTESKVFHKGINEEQIFNITFVVFSLNTFVVNGGQIKISAKTGNLSIYDIDYLIVRTHKGV